jgi:paired amphipathic helix protein Sin3a
LFKKDDPTFDYDTLDRIKRWRCYIASYTAVEPTEEVDLSRVSTPYLKSRFPKGDDLSDEERHDRVRHYDKITINVSPATYATKFIASEPNGTGGYMYFVHPDKVRAGLTEEGTKPSWYKALRDRRRERVEERLIRNTNWMKDVSRDDVDARKAAFKRDLEEPKSSAVEDGDEDDVEMAEP